MPELAYERQMSRDHDAIASCADEPIHIPGKVQSHGVLMSLGPGDVVVQATENVEALLGWALGDVMGVKPETFIHLGTADALATIVSEARAGRDTCHRVWVQPKSLPGARFEFDLRVHCHADVTLLELEPIDAGAYRNGAVSGEPEITLDSLSHALVPEDLLNGLATHVRRLTGFDLVMIYRFDAQWNGEVVAEDKSESARSYLGQRFPASDIPAQAREVFRQNWSRMICDVSSTAAGLVPILYPPTGAPLNLGRAQLRSPSPVHLEYLRNMGAGATFTISLVAAGRLWGLVACHHPGPRHLDLSHRRLCEWVGRYASQRIEILEAAQERAREDALELVVSRLHVSMTRAGRVAEGLFKGDVSMLELLPRHHGAGVALLYDGRWHLAGRTPNPATLRELYGWLSKKLQGARVYVTEHLAEAYTADSAAALGCAGLIAFAIEKRDPTVAVWFLPEVVQTIAWAGEPEKQISYLDGRARLHPRHSFTLWRQTVGDHAAPVLPAEIKAISELRQAIVECDLQHQVSFERMARLELQVQRRRLGVLSEASMVLARKGELEATMDAFAEVLAPAFCDWCVVHAVRQDHMRRVAVRHGSAEGQRLIGSLWDMPEVTSSDGAAIQEIYRPLVTAEDLAALKCEGEHLRLVRDKLGCHSLIIKPLVVRDTLMGWVVLVRGKRRAPFLPEDVELAGELAARAASSVESALHLERLAQSLAFRDQILNVVSHDLRNPLGVVSLSADGLQRQIDKQKPNIPELTGRALVKIKIACRRMDALIQDLLHIGKMQANRLSVAPKPQDCRALAQQSLSELELLAGQSRVELRLAPPPGDGAADPSKPGLQVCCDHDRFLQIVSNLVGNALKFSPPQTVITLGWRPPADGMVQFFVRDQGPGIPAENLPRVFEAFWQGGTNTSRVKGAGLGLAIVRGLVEAHGGRVAVTNVPGEGAEFTFTMPIVS